MPRWPELPLVARFWLKVDQSGGPTACWPWTGGRNTPAMRPWMGTRRPVFRVCSRPDVVVYATRFALSLHDGVPLMDREGLEACHTCHQPLCCNPTHLYWGTHEDNVRDRYPHRRRR